MEYFDRRPLLMSDMPRFNAERFPDRVALVHEGRRLCFRELNERVNRLANALRDLGINKGDRVATLFHNCIEAIESFLATQKIGAVWVPLNFRINARELNWCLDETGSRALIYSERLARLVEPGKSSLQSVSTFVYCGAEPPPGDIAYEQLLRSGSPLEPAVEVLPEDWSRFMFTGGTTGFPKIAVHTHFNVVTTIQVTQTTFDIAFPGEVFLCHPPVFHIGGIGQFAMIFAAGGCTVLVDALDPKSLLQLIEQERASYIFLIPPQTYINLLQYPGARDYDLGSVTRLNTSTGLLTPQMLLELFDLFPNLQRMYSGYGATELGTGLAIRIDRQLVEKRPDLISSCGVEYVLTQCRIIDDNGGECPPGVPGEAIFRSPANFIGYYENEEATKSTIDDGGWVHMGDIMHKDAEGYYWFVDRKKDMIKSGGENVFCQEVEAVIYAHPGVKECAVIGLPDPRLGETVTAVVVCNPGASVAEEEILALCVQQLSSYKKPRRIFFVDELPKSSLGKIQKNLLREQLGRTE